jgi:hypothetical protein
MKKKFVMICALCLTVGVFQCTALAAEPENALSTADISVTGVSNTAELLPTDVIQDADRSEIRKIYELSPDADPGRLPRSGFERGDYAYTCSDILREVVIGEESKTFTVTESAESEKNDTDTVLGLFPQYTEYADEDGFAGNLLLNTATVKSEVSGYGTRSTPYTVSRSYPNLSDADTRYIPKTIDDNGRTLQMQDVQWQPDNTMNVNDYEIGDRYTAIVAYGGTKTSGYVKGYTITADYSGEVFRKGVTVIRYTVIFTGTEISSSKTAPNPQPVQGGWIPLLLSVLALLGTGAGLYFSLKNRKETQHYEKVPGYDCSDAYADDIGDDPGVGGGDSGSA